MKKHPVLVMLLVTGIILGAGVSVAYYNTKSFGFDEDAVLVSIDENSITFFDFKIYFSDVNEIYNETKKYIPNKSCSTSPHLVADTELIDLLDI